MHRVLLLGVLLLGVITPCPAEEVTVGARKFSVKLLTQEDFSGVLNRWRFDGRGRAWVEDGRLHMDAGRFESTAWFTEDMQGELLISYEAHILDPVDKNNINLIFLTTAPDGGDVLNLPFTGSYPEYHKIPNYIWTFTGVHTRLRRNPGFEMVSEDKKNIPKAHITYQLALTIQNGDIRCYVNDVVAHSYRDPTPYRRGKLAFRTFSTRLWWDNLKVYRLLGR